MQPPERAVGHPPLFEAAQKGATDWCNRQSALSAIRPATARVLIVAEAMHETAAHDVPELLAALAGELTALWVTKVRRAVLTKDAPAFECTGWARV